MICSREITPRVDNIYTSKVQVSIKRIPLRDLSFLSCELRKISLMGSGRTAQMSGYNFYRSILSGNQESLLWMFIYIKTFIVENQH